MRAVTILIALLCAGCGNTAQDNKEAILAFDKVCAVPLRGSIELGAYGNTLRLTCDSFKDREEVEK